MFMTTYRQRVLLSAIIATAMVMPSGCRTAGPTGANAEAGRASGTRARKRHKGGRSIRGVRCLFTLRPWISLDQEGDRDPEGLIYRVFLDPGTGKGVLAPGMFHIALYEIKRGPEGAIERTLASDWHYPTSRVPTIGEPGMLGEGYVLHLRWARKDIAGREIEIVTKYESPDGRIVQSDTKRMRVPKYKS